MAGRDRVAEIKAYWTQQAREHGSSPAASWSDSRVIELEIAQIAPRLEVSSTVLDAGCGNGYSSMHYVLDRGVRLTGIDYVAEAIEVARSRREQLPPAARERVRFEVGDVRQLAFENDAFDAVVSTRVIINLPERETQLAALEEYARVLRPGGLLVLCEATEQGYSRLNALRAEWDLQPIPVPAFNRYLDVDRTIDDVSGSFDCLEVIDFASSYFVATRLLKPLLARACGGSIDVADPGSEFNRWAAQLPAAGDYGTQKLMLFRRRG